MPRIVEYAVAPRKYSRSQAFTSAIPALERSCPQIPRHGDGAQSNNYCRQNARATETSFRPLLTEQKNGTITPTILDMKMEAGDENNDDRPASR